MAKLKNIFNCQNCGAHFPQWQGQCSSCQTWNSIVEETVRPLSPTPHMGSLGYAGEPSTMIPLSEVNLQVTQRYATGMEEFDHVLGGGLVPAGVVLIGGDPGIGKSTLLLQTLGELSKQQRVLYISGEESLQQIALRAQRLQVKASSIQLCAETRVERIFEIAQSFKPHIMAIDSIQTMYSEAVASAPGSVSQVRETAAQLVRFAKQTGTILFLVGHVTKEGAIAGPRVLEHMVDTVLYFEGRSDSRFRLIRAVKNRFGAVNEIAVLAMTEKGLKQVSNPSAIFLSRYEASVSGSAIMVTWEGTRPLLVEVQALVDESHLANPRRVTVGLESNRLSMLLAVLHRHGGVATYNQDVFVNVVGGLRVAETASDLALLMAVISSLRNQPLPNDWVIFGEIGLAGEIRPVPSGQERLKEAAKHGFKCAIIPKGNQPKTSLAEMAIMPVDHLGQMLQVLKHIKN